MDAPRVLGGDGLGPGCFSSLPIKWDWEAAEREVLARDLARRETPEYQAWLAHLARCQETGDPPW